MNFNIIGNTQFNSVKINSPFSQFSSLLLNQNYHEAAKVIEKTLEEANDTDTKNDYIQTFRATVIDHFQKTSELPNECELLLEGLIEPDTEENAYGLHVDWMGASKPLFVAVLKSYITILGQKGLSKDEINIKLTGDFSGFLTYRSMRLGLAQAFVAEIPGFDPTKPHNPKYPCSQSCIEAAKPFASHDIMEYLNSLSPAIPQIENLSDLIDPSEFCGIAELQEEMSSSNFDPEEGQFFRFDTMQQIYRKLGRNPFMEGDKEFFRRELQQLVEIYQLTSQTALETLRQTYQRTLAEYESVKSFLQNRDINICYCKHLSLDTSMSHGHRNVGVISFESESVVCKFTKTIYHQISFSGLSVICAIADFVLKTRKLQGSVPSVVEVLPYVILNQNPKGDFDVGYLMKKVNGKQLREITHLSIEEKDSIQSQFDEAVVKMLEAGYVLYDFSDDNVLWDGEKLTFIDLSPIGFKEESLKNADTMDVIYRMTEMVNKKTN
jgi:hypothetical protein